MAPVVNVSIEAAWPMDARVLLETQDGTVALWPNEATALGVLLIETAAKAKEEKPDDD